MEVGMSLYQTLLSKSGEAVGYPEKIGDGDDDEDDEADEDDDESPKSSGKGIYRSLETEEYHRVGEEGRVNIISLCFSRHSE